MTKELACTMTQQATDEGRRILPLSEAISTIPHLVESLVTHGLTEQELPKASIVGTVQGLRCIGLDFSGAKLEGVDVKGGHFRGATFNGTLGTGSRFSDVLFIGCYLHGADFRDAVFARCKFIHCEVSKNDFCGADFNGSEFLDCDVYSNWAAAATLPNQEFADDCFGYDGVPPWELGLCEGHES